MVVGSDRESSRLSGSRGRDSGPRFLVRLKVSDSNQGGDRDAIMDFRDAFSRYSGSFRADGGG